MKNKDVCIIGAGISGLSCAILLQKQGYKVTIISKDKPSGSAENPSFASYFPSASIIPHSVNSSSLVPLFRESQLYFQALFEQNYPGISINEHYELFGFDKPLPAYAPLMQNLQFYEAFKESWHPKHPKAPIISGWKFNCFFADWSKYYPALQEEFYSRGGKLEIRELQENIVMNLPWKLIINCAGIGAVNLFNDNKTLAYRGHLVHVHHAPLLKHPAGQTISYNIYPGTDSSDSQEPPSDVYCYPRSDGWILGGSRQEGTIDNTGTWNGKGAEEPTENLNGLDVPVRILSQNEEIIAHSFGLNINNFPRKSVRVGYRYIRAKENGLRLEAEKMNNKLIIHNYGHGGAGVTLSWGCAKEVLSLINSHFHNNIF